jgi:hypothetical protein
MIWKTYGNLGAKTFPDLMQENRRSQGDVSQCAPGLGTLASRALCMRVQWDVEAVLWKYPHPHSKRERL